MAEFPRRCVITGMGIVCAAGVGVDAFQEALRSGRSGAREVPTLLSPNHQPPVAAKVQDEWLTSRRPRDRAFLLAEQAVAEALEQAGEPSANGNSEDGRKSGGFGLVLGTTLGGAIKAQRWHESHLAGDAGSRRDLLEACLDAVADHLARRFTLDGPRLVISNACVSGTNAIGLGLDLIRAGECRQVLAGGVDSLHSFNFAGFANLGALARDRCDPFHPAGRGMLLGEAAAFLVLEEAEAAKRRGVQILAEIAGYGSACDAYHITAPSREGRGAGRAIRAAFADAGVAGEDIDLVLLHGVGTAFMDGMESVAMEELFPAQPQPTAAASLRPVTGHTLGGVGAVDTVASVLAIREGFIPPTGRDDLPTRLPASVRLERECVERPVYQVLNTSSGFGGVNAAVMVRSWQPEGPPPPRPEVAAGDVVITGVGMLHPCLAMDQAQSLEALAAVLERGQPPTSPTLEAFDYSHFFPGRPSRRERKMDRVGRLASCAALASLQHAGVSPVPDPGRTALIGGTAFGGLEACASFHQELLEMGPNFINPVYFPNTAHNVACCQAAISLGIEGPPLTLTSGLAAGLDAILAGARALSAGRVDRALVGGYDCWFEVLERAYQRLHGAGKGPAPVEAACFLVLERAETAEARGAAVLGRLTGWAQASDPSPRREGGALTWALEGAGKTAGGEVSTWFTSGQEEVLGGVQIQRPKTVLGEAFGASGPLAVAACLACAPRGTSFVDAVSPGGAASVLALSTTSS